MSTLQRQNQILLFFGWVTFFFFLYMSFSRKTPNRYFIGMKKKSFLKKISEDRNPAKIQKVVQFMISTVHLVPSKKEILYLHYVISSNY